MNTNPKVDFFFEKESKWHQEYKLLRQIVLDCLLTEELKWGCPCYTIDGSNVVLIHGFKEYCALLLMKGALMSDTNGILIQQTENVQAGRQIRFTGLKQIKDLAPTLKAYIHEAIAIEKAGLKVTMKKATEYPVPEEFKQKLNEMPELKKAFEALTPGRQKGYLYYFGQPKMPKTREARIEKNIPMIMAGKGLED